MPDLGVELAEVLKVVPDGLPDPDFVDRVVAAVLDVEPGAAVEGTEAVNAEVPVEPGVAVPVYPDGVIGTGAILENVVLKGHADSVTVVLSVVGEASQAVIFEQTSVLVVLISAVPVPDAE
ncbi:hypothetical protein N7540_012529 [Penicillium herquei]|nr:hypothetical protein N7540_012529 [Penicillium herquei]